MRSELTFNRVISARLLLYRYKTGYLYKICYLVLHYVIYTITIELRFPDVRSIPFHAGEIVTTEPATQNQGLSVLESLAIGVCVLMLIFVYAAGIIFYIHYKQRQKRKDKDPENNTLSTDNGSTLGSRIDLNNVVSAFILTFNRNNCIKDMLQSKDRQYFCYRC